MMRWRVTIGIEGSEFRLTMTNISAPSGEVAATIAKAHINQHRMVWNGYFLEAAPMASYWSERLT